MKNPKGSIQEEIEKELGEFYFTHCKPEIRPKFKTPAELEAWNKTHLYQIEQIVKITARRISDLLSQTEERVREETIKKALIVTENCLDIYFKGLVVIPAPHLTHKKLKGILLKVLSSLSQPRKEKLGLET